MSTFIDGLSVIQYFHIMPANWNCTPFDIATSILLATVFGCTFSFHIFTSSFIYIRKLVIITDYSVTQYVNCPLSHVFVAYNILTNSIEVINCKMNSKVGTRKNTKLRFGELRRSLIFVWKWYNNITIYNNIIKKLPMSNSACNFVDSFFYI